MKRRIIYSDNDVLYDWSNSLYDQYSLTADFTAVAAEDSIYIGSSLPFNHFYIDISSANTGVSALSVEYWGGQEWEDVAELTDNTKVSGKTLGQSGFIEFVPDKNKNWSRDDTVNSSAVEVVDGLGGVTIYDQYWLKLTVSADLSYVSLNWIGSQFSNDNDLKSEFPDLTRSAVMTAFESGKTDWNEQHRIAAVIIAKDLIAKNIIVDENQILTREDLTLASVQKVASLIYNALGDDYVDQFVAAEKEYLKRLSASYVKVDNNANARIDVQEQRPSVGMLYR